MEQLIQEAVVTVPRALIAETIQFIAVLAGRGSDRRLAELACRRGPRCRRRLRPSRCGRSSMTRLSSHRSPQSLLSAITGVQVLGLRSR